ncbi:GUN4 domain-containing protein [Gloeocapsa sp. PCC 73106]|uniref:GUN4 domain-containing protein n=1 Tax=Gloeocapsa sp. PCC 73106 TaxID=102232 RepID=UPI0002AC7648|nr:GUN4 domain-containing protein [Gloeocapsa sp. PCC 73106]ELR99174.1 GUN4 [Gloeocapsa sp. PCC 73106]
MDNPDNKTESQLLAQIYSELVKLREDISNLQKLPEQVTQIEERLLLVGDIYRYQALQDYLSTQQWFYADKETVNLIMVIANVNDIEELSPHNIRQFPCSELRVIDNLWKNYSGGRFGFSVQLEIYQSLGGTLDSTIEQDQNFTEQWGARLGWRDGVTPKHPRGDRWRSCDELDFSLEAPVGCHPSRWWNSPYGAKMTNYFLQRLMSCET